MSGLFNVGMTSTEARMVFYAAYDRMSKDEWLRLRDEEYYPIMDDILERELELGRQGAMTS